MNSRAWLGAVALVATALAPATATPPRSPSPADTTWRLAAPDYRWSFPRDHYAHDSYRAEWWYFTGTLASEEKPARRFGYQLTFFRIALPRGAEEAGAGSAWAASHVVMAHFALGEIDGSRHHFSEVVSRASPLLGGFGAPGDARIAWCRAPAGTDAVWSLELDGAAFRFAAGDSARGIALSLRAEPAKPIVFQGPNGLSRKSAEGAASLYYSYTRMATSGALTARGVTQEVRGESWMDREFGSSLLGERQVGWDWFSLRLEDGRDLMLYSLRRADGSADWRSATLVARDGRARYLKGDEWRVRSKRTWRSADKEATYPAQWDVEVPTEGLRLEVVPEFADQENRSRLIPGLRYWEGAVDVRDPQGRSIGRGYVELTGYGKEGRLPL
jgi:predicted secreted hydrolase